MSTKVGRPREHDREQIAIDIIQWAKKVDSINLNKFCALYKPPFPPKKLSEWAKENDEFRESYEIAKAFLAFRREEKLNSEELHVKAYDLNAAAYDYFIKEEKMAQAQFEASLKTQTDSHIDEKIMENFDRTMKQLDSLQSSARKIDESKSNNEQKSA